MHNDDDALTSLPVSSKSKGEASFIMLATYNSRRTWVLLVCLSLCVMTQTASAFVLGAATRRHALLLPTTTTTTYLSTEGTSSTGGYLRQEGKETPAVKKNPLYPKAGDIVRYYEMDGGRADGQVLVGKISFLQKQLGQENKWLVELTELDNVGDGFYAEYPSRQRSKRKSLRPLENVSPIAASFVRSEGAYKIPRTKDELPAVRAEQYDIEGYQGPFSGENAINKSVIEADGEVYNALKGKLIRNAALAGVVGTLLANLIKGGQDAAIYATGALAGVGYLFFLSIKTDTVGSENQKLGANVSNLRFVLPVLVVTGVALYNKSLGDASPTAGSTNPFETITPEQYAAAVIGFLTYRIPLLVGQIKDALTDDSSRNEDLVLPGSAGMALKVLTQKKGAETSNALDNTIPVLLVSGPQAAGRTQLVKRLINEGNGRFVEPSRVDAVSDGAKFERLESRDEFLQIDPTGRYGVTKDGILNAGTAGESVVVVDADVDLARKLTKVSGARLIGVWVGLDSTDKFESRLKEKVQSGEIEIPPDETEESVIRAKIREIVKDIEYGIVSGIFEFTILNDNPEESIKELKTAADYCFA